MIDFACKQFNLEDVIKCGLSLTRSEFKVMNYFIEHINDEFTTQQLAKALKFDLTTIQKAVKKLSEHKIIIRNQKNLSNGGYQYTYESNSKDKIRKIIKIIIKRWSSRVEEAVDGW